jgi:hypothetical protein
MGVAAVKHTQLNSHQTNHTLPTSISQLGPEHGHFLPKTFSKTFTGSYKVRMYGAKFRVLVNLQVVFASPP